MIEYSKTKRGDTAGSYSAAAALLLLLVAATTSYAENKPRIAIIIDDLGYEFTLGRRVTELPGPVACAVLPGTPRGRALAEAANERGKEVLLHLPLQALEKPDWQEPGGIVLDMSRKQFAAMFARNIESVPYAVGVNTHRGSLLTRHPGHMSWLMEEINSRDNLFFVDSFTTRESIALRLAHESGVPAVKRDVFLDPDPSAATVEREFARLKTLARKRGLAVAIGHPYPATVALLERELPRLAADGFDLIGIGEFIAHKTGVRRVVAARR